MLDHGKPSRRVCHELLRPHRIMDIGLTCKLMALLQVVRWQVVSAFNIIFEVALFGMSILLVVGLRMPLARKSMVIAAFGLRLP